MKNSFLVLFTIALIASLSTYGLIHLSIALYKSISGETDYTFSLHIRNDGSGYLRYGADDILACKVLLDQ